MWRSGVGQSWEFFCSIPRASVPPDGPSTLSAELIDRAGNKVTAALGTIGLDTTAPGPPDTTAPDLIVHHRIPWGADETGGAPAFYVTGAASAASGATTCLVQSGTVELGRGAVAADGSFARVDLIPLGLTPIAILSVDAAGNVSLPATIHDEELVATLGGKVAGSSLNNPLRFDTFTAAGVALNQSDGLERGASNGLALTDDAGLTVIGSGSWKRHTFTQPAGRDYGTVVWDSTRARAIHFGGQLRVPGLTALSSETDEWDGTGWRRIVPLDPEGDGNPSARIGASFVYADSARASLLFGGVSTNGTGGNETWLFDGRSWAHLAGGPPARLIPAMFFDTQRSRALMFGGSDLDGGRYGDFWQWKDRQWTRLDAGVPSPRAAAQVAYDPERAEAWLFGGLGSSGNMLGDLWRFDGAEWSLVAPAGPKPPPRIYGQFAWDSKRRTAVLFGGVETGQLGSRWEWNGSAWSNPVVSGFDPGPRILHAMTYATAMDRMVTTGGIPDAGEPNQTWTFTGQTWDRTSIALAEPEAATPTQAVWLPAPIEFGLILQGLAQDPWVLLHEGWLPVPGSRPPPFEHSAMAFAPNRNELVWVGGDGGPGPGVTFVYGDGGFVPSSPGAGLGALFYPSLVATSLGLMALTSFVPGTQLRDATGNWGPGPAMPLGVFHPGTAALPDGGAVVAGIADTLDSGFNTFVFQLAGGTFQPLPSLPLLFLAQIVFDEQRQRVLLVGGLGITGGPLPASFELFSGGWRPLVIADPEGDGSPGGRTSAGIFFDTRIGRTVLFGGLTGLTSPNADVWELEIAHHRPCAVLRAAAEIARLPANATALSLTVKAVAGGSGQLSRVPVDGVELSLWRLGRWSKAGTQPYPANAAGSIFVTLTDPAELAHLFAGQPELAIRLTPVGENGDDFARLTVDSVELRLRARIP